MMGRVADIDNGIDVARVLVYKIINSRRYPFLFQIHSENYKDGHLKKAKAEKFRNRSPWKFVYEHNVLNNDIWLRTNAYLCVSIQVNIANAFIN